MSDHERAPKSYELLEDAEAGDVTLPAGHYSGIASWTRRLDDGKIVEGPTFHHVILSPTFYAQLGGTPNEDGSSTAIEVTSLIRDGVMI